MLPIRAILLLLIAGGIWSCMENESQTLSDQLDQAIRDKRVYVDRKEQRIAKLHLQLGVSGLTREQEYEINSKLYQEFKKYKLDSAIHYLERNVAIAKELNNNRYTHLSNLGLAQLYSSSGMCIEASKILKAIDPTTLPEDILPSYYDAFSRFYQHYAALSGQRKYLRFMELYRDSMILVYDPSSVQYKLTIGYKLNIREQPDSVESWTRRLFEEVGPESPYYAEVAYMLGRFYRQTGNDRLAKKYYMISAMADIRNATKENASFQALATIYYNNGDLSRAFKYTQAAIEDALFSNVQFRTAQMSELYSIIAASHQAKEAKTKQKLQHYLILISVLSGVLVLLFIYAYKQVRKLNRIREELSRTNAKLGQLNNELNGINEHLSDSNEVKEQYIAQFFDLCSMYIDKMDDYRKSLKRLAQNRQFEELFKRLKSTSMLEDELDDLYKNFDEIFLSLYPSFVSEFNALLNDNERITPKSGELLNKELRIYALLRLGITDSDKIASFLRCSLSTLYNYKTKMRNKAAGARDQFENLVQKIGTAPKIDK